MRGPKPPTVALTDEARRELEALAGAHRTPQQVAVRARIILAAADGENNRPRQRIGEHIVVVSVADRQESSTTEMASALTIGRPSI